MIFILVVFVTFISKFHVFYVLIALFHTSLSVFLTDKSTDVLNTSHINRPS